MDDDVVAAAQQITDVAAAEAKAEVVLAFYERLRLRKKMPEAVAHDLTVHEFYPAWYQEDE